MAAEREAGPGSSVSVHGVEAGTAMRFWPTREVGASASSLAGDHLVVVSVLHRTVESRVTGARARSSALKNTSPCPSRYRVLTIWCAMRAGYTRPPPRSPATVAVVAAIAAAIGTIGTAFLAAATHVP